MKRRFAAVLALLPLEACTLLFNPDNVKVMTCEPLPGGPLDAVAGEQSSLTFEWPNPAGRVDMKEWELCFGSTVSTMSTCRTIAYGSCRDAGPCAVTVDGADAGLQYNQRVFAQLVARNRCGDVSAPITTSATPLNGSFLDTQGITLSSNCDAGMRTDAGRGELVIEHPGGLCVSTALMGDELWRDATLELELRTFGNPFGGLAVRAPTGGSTSPRHGLLVSAQTAGFGTPQGSAMLTRREPSGVDVTVATATPSVRDATWLTLRATLAGPWVSLAAGPSSGQLREVIRWRDPGMPATGRLGLALVGGSASRLEVKNLRVRAVAVAPDGGPTSDRWTFSGPDPLRGVRTVGNASLVPCPSYPAIADGGSPSPGSQCLDVAGGGQGTLEAPIALDYSKRWRVRFKFAAETQGLVINPNVLRTTVVGPSPNAFNAMAGFALIDVMGGWNMPLRAFEDNAQTLGTLTPSTWNTFELQLDPEATQYTLYLNGTLARAGSSPAALAQHLGALVLGGGGAYHGWFTDVEIAPLP